MTVRRRLAQVVRDIVSRCTNPNHKSYHYYGGRGITIYGPWLENRSAFINYLMSLESCEDAGRVVLRKNRNAGYFPGNLEFATRGSWSRRKGVDRGEFG